MGSSPSSPSLRCSWVAAQRITEVRYKSGQRTVTLVLASDAPLETEPSEAPSEADRAGASEGKGERNECVTLTLHSASSPSGIAEGAFAAKQFVAEVEIVRALIAAGGGQRPSEERAELCQA